MYDLATWIDKSLEIISKKDLFKNYFLFAEMEDIEGTYFFTNRTRGIDITLSKELIVEAIHLTNDYLDYNAFKDGLPFNLRFDLNKDDIREILGEPDSTGGGMKMSSSIIFCLGINIFLILIHYISRTQKIKIELSRSL